MTISALTSGASALYQLLSSSQSEKSNASGFDATSASGTAQKPPPGPPPGPPPPSSDDSTSGTISNSSSKIIADLKSLLLDAQASTTASTGTAGSATAAGATAADTTTDTASTTGNGTLQADLKALFHDLGSARHGEHHGSSTDTNASSSSSASTTSTQDQTGTSSVDALASTIAKALQAYGSTRGQTAASSLLTA